MKIKDYHVLRKWWYAIIYHLPLKVQADIVTPSNIYELVVEYNLHDFNYDYLDGKVVFRNIHNRLGKAYYMTILDFNRYYKNLNS